MKKIFLIFCLSLLLSGSLFADSNPEFPSPATELLHKGSQARFALIFMSEGYQRHEMSKFKIDSWQMTQTILKNPTYSSYSQFFSIYRVNVISQDSGTDPSPNQKTLDTVFNSNVGADGMPRKFWAELKQIQPISRKVKTSLPTYAIVLVNSNLFAGTAWYKLRLAMLSAHYSLSPNILLHEMGHLLFDLGDEYDSFTTSDTKTYKGKEPRFPNVSIQNNGESVKWSHILKQTSEGGLGYDYKIWHPTLKCKMNFIDLGFCKVCKAYIHRFFLSLTPPITESSVQIISPIEGYTDYSGKIFVKWKAFDLEKASSRKVEFIWQDQKSTFILEEERTSVNWKIPKGREGKFLVKVTSLNDIKKVIATNSKSFYFYRKPHIQWKNPKEGSLVQENQVTLQWIEQNLSTNGSLVLNISPENKPLLSLSIIFKSLLNKGKINSSVQRKFKHSGILVSKGTRINVVVPSQSWELHQNGQIYEIKKEHRKLNVYRKAIPISTKISIGKKKYTLQLSNHWIGKINLTLSYINEKQKKELNVHTFLYYGVTNSKNAMGTGSVGSLSTGRKRSFPSKKTGNKTDIDKMGMIRKLNQTTQK